MQFSEIIGQEAIKKKLILTVKENRVSHAQLFLGPAGSGKLALAIAYAQYINCDSKSEKDSCGVCPSCQQFSKLAHPDLHFSYPIILNKTKKKEHSKDYINEWRNYLPEKYFYADLFEWYGRMETEKKQGVIGVKECNEIIRTLSYKSFEGKYKVMIIWMAERLYREAAPKLLKILEEPPEKTLFILIAEKQEPLFKNYSEEEGLPGNDIYDVLSSDKGLIWFTTDNGVSRFNGHEFVNFDVSDGLPSNSVIKLYEDLFGRVWFLAYDGMLSMYDNGEIYHYAYNDSIKKYFSDNFLTKIHVDSSGGMLISPRQGGKGYIDAQGNVFTRHVLVPNKVDSCYLSFEVKGDDFFETILSEIPENCIQDGKFHYIDDSYYIRVAFLNKEFQRKYVETSTGEYVVSYRNIIYTIKDQELVSEFVLEDEVLEIYEDREGKIWVSTKYDNGVYRFDNVYFDHQPEHYLKGYTVTCVVQDREDDYWLCTEGGGAFFIPSFGFRLFKHPDIDQNLNVIALAIYGNRLWFSTRDKGLYSGDLSEGEISKIRRADIGEPSDWIKYFSIDRDGYIWLTSTRHLRYDPAGFPRPIEEKINAVCVANGIGDTMLVATKELGIYHGDKLVYSHPQDTTNKRVYSLFQRKDKVIYIGTLYGLYQFKNSRMHHLGCISPVLNERIICIDEVQGYADRRYCY